MIGTATSTNAPSIPNRHGRDIETQRPTVAWIRRVLPRDPEPSEAEWQAIGRAITTGDGPMDTLVEWMFADDYQRNRALFDCACRKGIASVRSVPAPLQTFFDAVEATPGWVDPERLIEGQRASALAGRMGNYVLRDLVLIGGYQLSAVNKTLMATGALRNNPAKRLMETTKWFLDCMRFGGMEKFASGYVSTLQVRMIHALVRRQLSRSPNWDAAADGMPINQADLHNTYLGHSVVYLLGVKLLGVPLSADEKQAVMDLWRYIGWLMGVDEHMLHETEVEALIGLYRNTLSQPGPDESSRILAGALTDEPLSIRFGPFARVRGRWSRAVHLSIVRTFLGKPTTAAMGLPVSSPWYPLMTGPARLLMHKIVRAVPGGRDYLARRGLRQQLNELAIRTGPTPPARFAPHIQAAAQAAARSATVA
jgi:hypothetical protein